MRSSILAVLFLFAVLGLTASASSAGPNAGGVLWVHDTGVVFSTDPSLPPMSTPPADCAGVDNQQDADGVDRIWKVYAAFPEGSSSQLKSTGFGTRFPDGPPDPYITINAAGCGAPPGVTWDGTRGFPTASGGEVWLNFASPGLETVVWLFYFTGSAGTGQSEEPRPLTWCTFLRSSSDENVFLDDAVPQHVDPILGYGCLGFGVPGSTPCPQPPTGCCCDQFHGSMGITTQAACLPPAVWLGADVTCNAVTCPPWGACCDRATGNCTIMGQTECLALGPWFEWLGTGVPCNTVTCQPTGCCCTNTGTTEITTAAACAGYWAGAGVLCSPDPCPGACCDRATGNCTIITGQTACLALGPWFEWLGTGVPCNAVTCQPTGCCCDPTVGVSSITTAADCRAIWLGPGVSCSECTQLGACCDFTAGVCTTALESWCHGSSEVWLGVGVSCHPNPCLLGACCNRATGGCDMTTAPGCMWDWHPEWQSCDPNPCTAPCCDPVTGACAMTTHPDCVKDWRPDLRSCEPNQCPQPLGVCIDCSDGSCSMTLEADCRPTPPRFWILGGLCEPYSNPDPCGGACCVPGRCCEMMAQAACEVMGGLWHQGLPCVPNPCPQPISACCFPDGSCQMLEGGYCVCIAKGVVYYPLDVCEPNPCLPLGVCCNYILGPPADCTITTALNCQMPMEWHPDWPLVCDPDPCSPTPLTGSCCYSDGVCAVTTQPVCTLPAIWTQGAGCVPNACPQPTGSCCYPGGTCAVTAQAACAGTWHEGGACEPNPCAQPPAQGACCDHATGGCTITAQAACQFTWLGAGVPCNPTTCIPPTPVERTSWGKIKNIYR